MLLCYSSVHPLAQGNSSAGPRNTWKQHGSFHLFLNQALPQYTGISSRVKLVREMWFNSNYFARELQTQHSLQAHLLFAGQPRAGSPPCHWQRWCWPRTQCLAAGWWGWWSSWRGAHVPPWAGPRPARAGSGSCSLWWWHGERSSAPWRSSRLYPRSPGQWGNPDLCGSRDTRLSSTKAAWHHHREKKNQLCPINRFLKDGINHWEGVCSYSQEVKTTWGVQACAVQQTQGWAQPNSWHHHRGKKKQLSPLMNS